MEPRVEVAADEEAPPFELWPEQRTGARRREPGQVCAAVTVLPRLARKLKEHQRDGVRFMWAATVGARRQDHARRVAHGCVLAHGMGLGKTLQTIAYLHTALLRARTPDGREYVRDEGGAGSDGPATALVIVPKSVGKQWDRELSKWLHNALAEQVGGATLRWNRMEAHGKAESTRLRALRQWREGGGIMLMEHETFRRMAEDAVLAERANISSGADMKRLLLSPGADILVVDEARLLLLLLLLPLLLVLLTCARRVRRRTS